MEKQSKNRNFLIKHRLEICSKFWEEFIEIYKSHPEIWDVKSPEYKDRKLKNRAYKALAEKLQEIDPDADVEAVKRKINNLRTTYRRELHKVRRSERSGAEEVYCPTLWYFDLLDFLDIREPQEYGVSTDDIEDDATITMLEEEGNPQKKLKSSQHIPKKLLYEKVIELLDLTKQVPDEAKTLSATWESMYRNLDEQQQFYANRTIMETLYQGSLGNLHANSHHAFEIYGEDFADSGSIIAKKPYAQQQSIRPIATTYNRASMPVRNGSSPPDVNENRSTYKLVKAHPVKLIPSNIKPSLVSSDDDIAVQNSPTKKVVTKKRRKISR